MFRRLAGIKSAELQSVLSSRAEIRWTTVFGLALGALDVLTTAEHLLVPPVSDGNPLLMAIGGVSPVFAYGLFVGWFLFVASVALFRDDILGYSADTYLLIAFSLTGLMNTAYILFGTTLFKEFVGQYTTFVHLYILVLAPLGSVAVGYAWTKLARPS